MSSLIDASQSLGQGTQDGESDSGIIHFDATQRRKDKMRRKSQDAPQKAEPTPPEAIQKPAPVAEVPRPQEEPPQPPQQAPAPAKPATLDAYAAQPVAESPAPLKSLAKLSGAELEAFLIDFVVEQTGYPPEMVELDADLEADLGIDSIKKAQLFGELAEQFEITVDVTDESLSLDDFPTLAHVMEFLEARSGDAPEAKAPATPPVSPAAPEPAVSPIETTTPSLGSNGQHEEPAASAAVSDALAGVDLETFLVDFVVEQTGYPPEMVELDADLEADLGIDSIKKAQLFGELAEQFEITVDVTDESLSLDDFPTLRHVLAFLKDAGSPTPKSEPASPQIEAKITETTAEPAPLPVQPAPVSGGTHVNGAASKTPAPEPAPASAPSDSSLGQEDLETFLVNFVVEQTGYPPEMVELDADLEADLGIDSIKKAQMMGELAEQFEITVDVTDEDLSLDDFPTLRHVCEFLAAPGKVSA